jgi:hypothetical protein
MAFADLQEEIAQEFSAFGGYREFHEGFGRDVRKGRKQKQREHCAFQGEVAKARLVEKAKRTPAKNCCCGKALPKLPHKRGPHQRYCSSRCYHRDYYHRKLKPIGAVIRNCERCGAPFDRRGYLTKRFCSEQCQSARRSA